MWRESETFQFARYEINENDSITAFAFLRQFCAILQGFARFFLDYIDENFRPFKQRVAGSSSSTAHFSSRDLRQKGYFIRAVLFYLFAPEFAIFTSIRSA
jgi:hypothetical protein